MADHADHLTNSTGVSIDAPSHEIGDFHLFSRGENLVFSIALNPTNRLRAGEDLSWPTSMKLKVSIDLDSKIVYDDELLNNVAGGRFVSPESIKEDIIFNIRVKEGAPIIKVLGDKSFKPRKIKKAIGDMFAGTRSETFQFGPNIRSNRNLIVFEVDRGKFLENDSDKILSAWSESILKEGKSYIDSSGEVMTVTGGPYKDKSGRALKDQAPGLRMQNSLHPSEHVAAGFGYPDMMILDTTKKVKFPNGRRLQDDVITYLTQFDFTTPPVSEPGNRAAVDGANDAQTNFSPVQGILADAEPSDLRYWNQFPYVGEAFNIPNSLESEQVYRFKEKSGGYFYLTSNAKDIHEIRRSDNFVDEGIIFSAAAGKGKAVHRLLNRNDGSHFWTIDPKELKQMKRKKDYTYEGETFFVEIPESATAQSTQVYRLFDPLDKHYVWTADKSELSTFVDSGWTNQGLAWTV
jgi:hypothetical protein